MWHPARVTKKQQQKRDQPEVGPEIETGYHQMVGGNLHVVFKKNAQWFFFNPPGARVRFPRNSSTVAGQGRVTAALDAQDHGMVTCAFPKSISSPGMIPFSLPLLLLHCAKKQQSSGSRDGGTSMSKGTDPVRRGGARAWAVGWGAGEKERERERASARASAKQRIQQRYAAPLWGALGCLRSHYTALLHRLWRRAKVSVVNAHTGESEAGEGERWSYRWIERGGKEKGGGGIMRRGRGGEGGGGGRGGVGKVYFIPPRLGCSVSIQ